MCEKRTQQPLFYILDKELCQALSPSVPIRHQQTTYYTYNLNIWLTLFILSCGCVLFIYINKSFYEWNRAASINYLIDIAIQNASKSKDHPPWHTHTVAVCIVILQQDSQLITGKLWNIRSIAKSVPIFTLWRFTINKLYTVLKQENSK